MTLMKTIFDDKASSQKIVQKKKKGEQIVCVNELQDLNLFNFKVEQYIAKKQFLQYACGEDENQRREFSQIQMYYVAQC